MIKIVDLHKRFGDKVIYSGLQLEVPRGETRVILGGSGVGKSVLLKHIIGLLEPDRGTIEVDGMTVDYHDREALERVRKKVGMLFQGAALFDSLNVRDNVAFALLEEGSLSDHEMDQIVAENLELVNLPGVESLFPSDLSGGMRKRVALARALAPKPEVLLYDEPTTGLDPINAHIIDDLIRETQRKLGVTSIVVTHDLQSACRVGDRLSLLYKGRILATGTPDELLSSTDPVVHQFMHGLAQGPITEEKNALSPMR
ncbi:MAG: ABC transporter ATP-binding protein [bacterium]